MDAEGGLAGNNEDYEKHIMSTGLDREVPEPKGNYNYVNTLVMLSRGNNYYRRKVIGQKRDADGNAIGRRNKNPIIDMREYHVEFDDGEVRQLTANVIAESISDTCDDYGNMHLMIDLIVDYRNDNKSITVPDQKVVLMMLSIVYCS